MKLEDKLYVEYGIIFDNTSGHLYYAYFIA
jgi:hypothetical protein